MNAHHLSNCFARAAIAFIALALPLCFSAGTFAAVDVTMPGDPITPTSNNSPGSEGVANAIDNAPTKYLNFDRLNTGFTVMPSSGFSIVQSLTLTSANDAPERDPASYLLQGSADGINFTTIASGAVPAFASRFQTQTVSFANNVPYSKYKLIFPTVAGPGGNSMQISEVEFLGTPLGVLLDVTAPGDPITPTSNNSPGSEGVANAIDDAPTKYLNFDRLNTGFTVTPSSGFSIVRALSLTSANDAPERDPASYLLQGSADGINFTTIASGAVPAFASRFQTQTVSFANNVPYSKYKLIFPTVAGPGGNSMQISETAFLGTPLGALVDVTAPGDPITPTSNNSPGSEGVANAIDDAPTKYLNFDRLNTGFTVTPRSGLSIVRGLALTSANDAPERDPATYLLEGSIDGVTFQPISSGFVPVFTTRFQEQVIMFSNDMSYSTYKLIFPTVVGPGGNSLQISEVKFLGTVLVPEPGTMTLAAISASLMLAAAVAMSRRSAGRMNLAS